MPYQIIKSGKGYFVVNTMTGHAHSKKPMTLNNAKAQLRILNQELEGAGVLSYLKNVFNPNSSPQLEKVYEQYKNWDITGIKIYRNPIMKVATHLLNLFSLGKYDELKKKKYDDAYHLYMVLELHNPQLGSYVYLQTEKQPNITFDKVTSLENPNKAGESLAVKLEKPVNFGKMVENLKAYSGKMLYKYSNPYNNCQRYVYNILRSTFELNNEQVPKPVVDFVLQDFMDIVTGTTRNVANFITNIIHTAGRVLGYGDEY